MKNEEIKGNRTGSRYFMGFGGYVLAQYFDFRVFNFLRFFWMISHKQMEKMSCARYQMNCSLGVLRPQFLKKF